ncbi:MAG: hypothetical protein V3V86_03355 [Gammaproteobacteria bacterium]
MSDLAQKGQGTGRGAVLGGRYQIHPEKPLPQLDSPMAHAVAATDLRSSGREMFALACRLDLLPRIDFIPQISRMERQPVIIPVDAGAVDWPESGGRRFVIVFELNFGERVCPSPDATLEPMHEDTVVRTVIRPLMPLLKELSNRYIPHRAIRADNLFYADGSRQAVILGECVSAPPSISQPVAYEPIESAMAKPSARGLGLPADDLYSFGALLAFLLTGGEMIVGKSDEEIVRSKVLQGSYSTLLGDARVSLSMMEPLRGLLCDDPKDRWTAADVELWLGGRKQSPMQPMLPPRASRSLTIGGHDYWTKLSLCNAMGENWQEAGQLINSGELARWLQRALSDTEASKALMETMESASIMADSEERLTAKTLIVLEPSLPLRYKDLCAKIDGLTDAFAIDYHDQQFRQSFIDMVTVKLPQIYLQSQPGTRSDQVALMKHFDMINFFLDRPAMGAGIERALYETNQAWPCQSPLVQNYYVYEIQDLLPALERVAEQGGIANEVVDRHIAAFCAARVRSLPERILRSLDKHDDIATFRLGVLHLLAEVQRAGDTKRKFPALCKHIASSVQPIIDSYHNCAYRERLAQEIESVSGKGNFLEILFLLDSLDARNQDAQGFERAKREYAGRARTIAWLQNGGLTSAENIRFRSQQAATLLSATVSAMMIVALSLLYIT